MNIPKPNFQEDQFLVIFYFLLFNIIIYYYIFILE